MKLYTEEQVIDAITKAFLAEYPSNGNDILKELTPIELPSDEEIAKGLRNEEIDTFAAYKGAIWMKKQILNQNK